MTPILLRTLLAATVPLWIAPFLLYMLACAAAEVLDL